MFCHCDTIGFITACSKGLLKTDVHINATTGSTGAGVSPSETTPAGDQITCRITKHSTTSI
jgi:hypothetical protein